VVPRAFMSVILFTMISFEMSIAYELKTANWNWLEETPKTVHIWINPNCSDDPSAYPP